MTAKKKKKQKSGPGLFRVIFRGRELLGTWDEWHAKVVASGILGAIQRALQALELDESELAGCAATLIQEETQIPEGKVFEVARRSRAFGGRGGWIDEPSERIDPEVPRKTPLL